MARNSLHQLQDVGQSIWLDYIDRTLLTSGELARRLETDALSGMTSNPTIFEKAMAEGTAYDAQLASAAPGLTAWDLFELVETTDVRTACDVFRPIYDRTRGGDGYVSIEVSPGAADNADATVAEAHRLWGMVDRPNVMIKVPGTDEGAIAVRRLLADGINVNITLLFAVDAYARIIDAFFDGLEARASHGEPIDRLASVASFFVSRVDTEVDKRLEARIASGGDAGQLRPLQGKAAVANAKMAYALFQERFRGPRWDSLSSRGARVQRPLWASTSTKNPAYRDVMYVEELIGPHTVNTMPPATIEAVRDHGVVRRTVDQHVDEARETLAAIERAGVSMQDVTAKLLVDGIASFQKSFETLVERLEQKVGVLTSR
jgi:transaldolase